jgi:hypothetical protein
MAKCLTWISVLFLLALPASAQLTADSLHRYLHFDSVGTARYSICIEAKQMQLSGICMLKDSDEIILGSVFNEFGIKAFDMSFEKPSAKMTLLNVVDFLDKWYIRGVVKGDLTFLFDADKQKGQPQDAHRSINCDEKGTIVLKNIKYGLTYTFTPLKSEEQENKEDETTE